MATITETVDAPGGAATPYALRAGDVFYGTMSQNATDWVAVTLEAGKTYSFGAVGLGAAGSGVTDPFLRLHAAGGGVLAQNDDGGPGFAAQISFTAAASGTFYLEARALSGAPDGAYGLVVTEGARPSYGAEFGAAVLYREGDSWAAGPGTGATVTWGVRALGPALDAEGDPAPFQVLTAAQIAAARAALAQYAEVAGIVFQQVAPGGTTTAATILIGGYDSATDGAAAYANYPGSTAAAGDVWINTAVVSGTSLPIGSFDSFVFLHELGHALGLAHPGDYNAAPGVSIFYADAAQFTEDSQQYSVMSYFGAAVTEPGAPGSCPDTLMLYDILAVQKLYGVNAATRAGNDVYGFNTTLGGAYDFSVNSDPLLCIWDGGGRDTLNLSGFRGAQVIDLNDGAFSDVGGFNGNLSIALGAVIENSVGGRGADRMLGNEGANWLRGGRGNDLLAGGQGNDLLGGNAGADAFVFGQGDGRDRVTDFNRTEDWVRLSAGLWGGVVLTAAEVLDMFGVMRRGHLVLDFGADELTLAGVSTLAGIDSQIVML